MRTISIGVISSGSGGIPNVGHVWGSFGQGRLVQTVLCQEKLDQTILEVPSNLGFDDLMVLGKRKSIRIHWKKQRSAFGRGSGSGRSRLREGSARGSLIPRLPRSAVPSSDAARLKSATDQPTKQRRGGGGGRTRSRAGSSPRPGRCAASPRREGKRGRLPGRRGPPW